MGLHSNNRTAFEQTRLATLEIERYREDHDPSHLREAERRLDAALDADPQFVLPKYYRGVLLDLRGDSADAAEEFENLLTHPNASRLRERVLLNLGVSRFHQYHRENLEQAFEQLDIVVKDGKDRQIVSTALAYRARARAHTMILFPDDFVPGRDLPELGRKLRMVDRDSEDAEEKLDKKANDVTKREVKASALNSRGAARMFYSDWLSPDAALRTLDEALSWFLQADQLLPSDWAIQCNLGSTHMRRSFWLRTLGRAEEAERAHALAQSHLRHVLKDLRPDYAFARYELGRTARLHGDFIEAADAFQQVKLIQDRRRDVSMRRLERELALAQKHEASFP